MRCRTPLRHTLLLTFLTVSVGLAGASSATTIDLAPVKDNSMYEDWPEHSNGAGDGIYVGKTLFTESLRRGLVAFDLSAIPAGSTINSASLTLVASLAHPVSSQTGLHRANADWGEAGSNGTGTGAPAQTGEATWSHRFWATTPWTSPGGDFVAGASASTTVGDEGTYVWTGPGLVADVSFWVDNPGSNFGWVLIGDEATLQTAKRFYSREGLVPPKLTVDYTPPPVPGLTTWGSMALALATAGAALPFIRRRRERTPA